MFGTRKSCLSQSRRRDRKVWPALESLEDRKLMAASVTLSGGVLKIEGTSQADVAKVTVQGNNLRVTSRSGSETNDTVKDFAATRVAKIVFNGYAGSDSFRNSTAVPSSSGATATTGSTVETVTIHSRAARARTRWSSAPAETPPSGALAPERSSP